MLPTREQYLEVMAKHLPPSAASLKLLDVGGACGLYLQTRRPDIDITIASLNPDDWQYASQSADAITAYDLHLTPALLETMRPLLRAGGRLIVVNSAGTPNEAIVHQLEQAGYIRILVEPAVDGHGVLIRGEQAHTTVDTHARIQIAAAQDADLLDITTYRGRFIHFLVQQSPNKPVWRLEPDEEILWRGVAVASPDALMLLGFSSLPKAVAFMQPAVMQGFIQGVNKVAKFSKHVVEDWPQPILLNPTLTSVAGYDVQWLSLDPSIAEAPDE